MRTRHRCRATLHNWDDASPTVKKCQGHREIIDGAIVKRRRFTVRGYYAGPGRRLALETWHTTEHSKDMEVEVLKNRLDIGEIEVLDYDSPKPEKIT